LITVFDADPAGIQATLRSLPLFLEEEVAGKTIVLPKGEDPDGFLRKGNLEDFGKRMELAVSLIDFFFERLMKAHDVKSVDGKVKIAKEGVALLGKIPDKIRRDFYTKALAERLDVKESFLHEILDSSSKGRSKAGGDLGKPSTERSFPKAEEMVIHLMVQHPEIIPAISKEGVLKEFESPILQKIAEALEDLYQRRGKFNLPQALANFDEDLKGWLSEFAFQENGLEGEDRGKILEDCIQKIREKKVKKEKGELQRRIKEADKQQGDKGLNPLLKQKLELARKGERALQKEGSHKR
jgi:DNA primase